jgi:hypothetical protein
MANRFNRPARHTEIKGASVCALPVPFRYVRDGIAAEAAGDHAALLAIMAQVVGECVRYSDGTPVDPNEIDCATIAELFAFASGKAGDANFTPPASSASPAPLAEAIPNQPPPS